MCLLCVASASAVTYGNPYRGAGRNGYVATGYRSTSTGLSQAPTATMRSTSSAGYGTAYAATTQAVSGVTTMQVQGMYTAASAVRGGVTSSQTYSAMSGARKAKAGIVPGNPGSTPPDCGCKWVYNEETGTWTCERCEYEWDEYDEECHCEDECGYCWCPIGDGWDVWIMLAVMAVSYVLFMRRRNEKMQNNLHNSKKSRNFAAKFRKGLYYECSISRETSEL